jgi:hypothetical protein
MYKLKWSSAEQINLNMVFGLCRKENKAVGLCMPRFFDFSEYYRHHRIKLWCHIFTRGFAVVFVKDSNPFALDTWHVDVNYKVLRTVMDASKLNYIPIEKCVRFFNKLINFYLIIRFPDFTPEEKELYEKLYRENTAYRGLIKKDDLTPKQQTRLAKMQKEMDALRIGLKEALDVVDRKQKSEILHKTAANAGKTTNALHNIMADAVERTFTLPSRKGASSLEYGGTPSREKEISSGSVVSQ